MKNKLAKKIAVPIQVQSKIAGCMATISFLGAALCANAQNLNGTLDTAFYGSPLYVQTINTGFGNSAGGGDASGSELDAVYVKVSGGNLYLFVSGCLQANGNHLNVFIAGGDVTGQTTLAVPTTATMKAMNGSVFPAGFTNTFALDINDSSSTLYTEEYVLTGTPSGGYVGALPGTSGIFAGSSGGVSSLYLDNTLVSTMGTANDALSGSNVGASVTNGLEIVIPTSAIGYTGGSVKVVVDVNGGGDVYLSNQFLPGLAVGSANLGTSTFNLGPIPPPTNQVTFQVDLSPQVISKTFTNGSSTITVSGGFEGWDDGLPLTNNPAAPNLSSNIYSGTFPAVGFLPDPIFYKFRANGGWEDGDNRTATITNSTQVLPLVFYNNSSLSDLMAAPTLVKFSLYLTNGTLDTGGSPFIKGVDKLNVNGNFFDKSGNIVPAGTGVYWTWNTLPGSYGPPNTELIESEIPDVYTNSFLLPAGSGYKIEYKYSQDGFDDENGFATNHVRYVRSYPPSYVFPQDVWSLLVTPPYPNSIVVEPSFGNLVIGAPVGTSLPIMWLGRPAVILQSRSSLNSGVWIDNNGTDGTQNTNWPNIGGTQFFRLEKKP